MLLGKSLNSCVKQHCSEQVALDRARCAVGFWRKPQSAPVAMTATGFVGDSNTAPYWSLLGHGKSRESLVRSEKDYRFSMSRQLVTRTVNGLTVSDQGWKGAPCEGLDNRQLLPPFTPVERGEDVIFGMLVEFSSSAYFGYLPWMIHHRRTSQHSFRREDLISGATRACSYTQWQI
jgi:hypothetical protein